MAYYDKLILMLVLKSETVSLAGPTNPSYIPNVPTAYQAQVVAGASGGNTFGIPAAFGSQNAPPPNMPNYTSQVNSEF